MSRPKPRSNLANSPHLRHLWCVLQIPASCILWRGSVPSTCFDALQQAQRKIEKRCPPHGPTEVKRGTEQGPVEFFGYCTTPMLLFLYDVSHFDTQARQDYDIQSTKTVWVAHAHRARGLDVAEFEYEFTLEAHP